MRPDFTYVDHRWGGVAPSSEGPDGFLDHVRSARSAGFVETGFETLAIRGDRLSLACFEVRTEAGDVVGELLVNEVEADGLATRTEVFDAGDLARAVELLDRWYLEGEGADLAWMIRPGIAFWHGYNARDWDEVRSAVADEVELVDHRPASAGTSIQTADQLVTYAQGMIELVPDLVAFEAEYLAVGRAWALSRQVAHGTSTGGSEIERPSLILADSRDGRFTHTETFAPEQLAEALARFAEVEAAEPSIASTVLSNRVTRGQDAFCEAFAVRDWEAMASSYADDLFNDDRRTGVSSGVTVGREEVLGLVRGLVDVGFATVTSVPIAIRGERLAIVRRTWHQTDGFDLPLLSVVEYDADDRMTANVMFDTDDVPSAHEELERRCLAERDGRTASTD